MFEPSENWIESLPWEPALGRLEQARFETWAEMSEAERIAMGWTLLVADREEALLEGAVGVPNFAWSAVGLLDSEVDRGLERSDPQFGVIFYVNDIESAPERLGSFEVEGVGLPVVQRPIAVEEHRAGVPAIPGGQLACWATSAGGMREGWLTARHVAAEGGHRVVDSGRECIDAALIDVGTYGGGSYTRAVAPGGMAQAEVHLSSGPRWTRVLDVATNFHVKPSSYFPLRFTTVDCGVEGDSGSLILAQPCGEPLGIYLGALTTIEGRQAGVGLAITQLETLMNLEVFL
jgi:hypothetical protein